MARESIRARQRTEKGVRSGDQLLRREDDGAADDALIGAIGRDPDDATALQALVNRHWQPLYARCYLLTADREAARELAQDTWCRVLRARRGLRSEGSFAGYLSTIATNLWRDRLRSVRRSGALAEHRFFSLESPGVAADDESPPLADTLADPTSLDLATHVVNAIDVDRALAALPSLWRDVMISRFVDGESAAEIGRRYQRSEQTVTGWIRRASLEMQRVLGGGNAAPRGAASGADSGGAVESARL